MKHIDIPDPEAVIGDPVMALNYRRKHDQWERGTVVGATYSIKHDNNGGYWQYRVVLERRTPSKIGWMDREEGDNPILIHVGDRGIELAE